jgi:AraC-like DNA-binding protein
MIHPNDRLEEGFQEVLKEHIGEDLMVMEGMGNIPSFNFTYDNPYVVVTLCTNGWIKGRYNHQDIVVRKGDLSVLLPNQLVSTHDRSDDFSAISILMDKSFAQTLQQVNSLKVQLYFSQHLFIHLSEEEQTFYSRQFETIRFILRRMGEEGIDMVKKTLDVIYGLLMTLDAFKEKDTATKSRQEFLVEQFYEEVIRHCRESREVIFYADKLCITPKYLSSIVKQATGKSANDWINQYVIREAKRILKAEKNMTVQEVSDALGFPDQATFSKYFKKHVCCTPTDYRTK